MRLNRFQISFLCIITSLLGACSESTDPTSDDFDRVALLQNMADNIIRPNYADLQTKVDALNTAINIFVNEPDETSLSAAQVAWETAYTSWQNCTPFNFGPGGPAPERPLGNLEETIGIFPVNTSLIESNITNGETDLNTKFGSEKGFIAIEYMLFEDQGNSSVVDLYTSNANNRIAYLQALITEIKDEVDATNVGWTNYESTFLSNTGTDFGSSTSQLFNAFVASYEVLKNAKVGIPTGQRLGETQIAPEQLEAFYSGISLQLIKAHLDAIENVWRGRSALGTDRIGFEEYIATVEGGADLIASTEAQILAAHNAINNIPAGDLAATLQSNPDPVIQAHTELQQLTRFFKSDMASLLGLSITFNSGDGD